MINKSYPIENDQSWGKTITSWLNLRKYKFEIKTFCQHNLNNPP